MAEINGYILTKNEEEACANLIKKMRNRSIRKKRFAVDFTGCIEVNANTHDEAMMIFWNWVGDIQGSSSTEWQESIAKQPYFECEGVEEE